MFMFVSMFHIEKVSKPDLRKRVRELGEKEDFSTQNEKLGLTFYLIRNQKSNLTHISVIPSIGCNFL